MKIFLWGDPRHHHKSLLEDILYAFKSIGVGLDHEFGLNIDHVIKRVNQYNPDWFFMLGGKKFPRERLKEIRAKKFARWLFGQSLPKIFLKEVDLASCVNPGAVCRSVFLEPHYIPTLFFNRKTPFNPEYVADTSFIGWAGSQGKGIYERSKRNLCLESKKVTYWNRVWGKDEYDWNTVAQVHKSAKIGLNVTHRDNEINMRVFEYAGVGTMILSDRNSAMNDLLEEGKHYVGFEKGNLKEMEDKIDYYLSHDKERERIALSAHKELMRQYTTNYMLQRAIYKMSQLK